MKQLKKKKKVESELFFYGKRANESHCKKNVVVNSLCKLVPVTGDNK